MSETHLDQLSKSPDSHPQDGHGGHHAGIPHGTFKGYMTGFVLSVILTAIPFYLVMAMPIPNAQLVGFTVVAFAVVQILVHMIFFLHLDPRSEGGWIILALVFTIILVVIAIAGTMWVMYHLNANMMPIHDMPGS
ncbi:MAG: cytochrome o ubiquinol oxidase subunit IV [Pseudomonadota bacterium]